MYFFVVFNDAVSSQIHTINDGTINKQQARGLKEVEETDIDVIWGTIPHLSDELRRTTKTLCQDSREMIGPRFEARTF